ncbi:MAG: PmoA family protein [Acidobacteria bacterium]|nr:PmoA family protein [Acidobacteriota bacterium]MCI0536364.1 PmoA family protein [Verrucomicrobiales bacterium]MCI0724534.1 PmoA family protein [Acidobacteriota bacterium]
MNLSNLIFSASKCNAFSRRLLLGGLIGILGQPVSLPAQSPETKPTVPYQTRFRFEPVSEKSLGLWEGEHPVFVYNHGVISSRSAPNAQGRSSYIHPVYGLDGEVLTDDFPKDHVNHRGLHWAWPHIKIGEQEYDLWSMRGIRYEFQRWLARETHTNKAVLGVENGWLAGEKEVMREKVWVTVHPASSGGRAMDVDLTWTPTDRPVTLWGAEGKSYGGLTLRFGPRSKTIITVPTGRASDDLLVTRLTWADLSGDLKGAGELSGATVFVHPEHPGYPPTWMTRHYGLLAVGWPGVAPHTMPPGKSVSCRYRIWIHRGVPEAAEIQKAYEAYRTGGNVP